MARSFLSILLAFLAVSGSRAWAQDVEVQVVEERPEEGAGILAVRRPRDASQSPPRVVVVERVTSTPQADPIVVVVPPPVADPIPVPDEEPELFAAVAFGMFLERIELAGLGLAFEAPEVGLLEGTHVPPMGPWGSPLVGGASFGSSVRPLPWLILPEMRIEIGGGSSDGPWVPPQGASSDVTARLTSIFLLRAQLRGGIVLPFRWVQPYVVGHMAASAYFVDADVRHATLGELGTENMVSGAFDAGFEAGATFTLGEDVYLYAAWRESFTGARASGATFGITVAFPDE